MSMKPFLSFVALVLVAACSGSSASPSSGAGEPAVRRQPATPSTAVVTPSMSRPPRLLGHRRLHVAALRLHPRPFLPAGRVCAGKDPAGMAASQPSDDFSSVADRFVGPASAQRLGLRWAVDLRSGRIRSDRIAATARDHGDTCPVAEPEVNEPLQIGGEPWVLLGWNCGALINTGRRRFVPESRTRSSVRDPGRQGGVRCRRIARSSKTF